jgi:hypothetical protein
MYCAEVVEVVEHRNVVNIDIGVPLSSHYMRSP